MTEASLDAFRQKFSITVNVEGDDCDAKQNSLWLGYWTAAIAAVRNNPPTSGKAFITINVGKQKDLTVSVKDSSTFTIDAPKDIAATTSHSPSRKRHHHFLPSLNVTSFTGRMRRARRLHEQAWQ